MRGADMTDVFSLSEPDYSVDVVFVIGMILRFLMPDRV